MKNMGLCLYISTAWMSVVFVLVPSILYSTVFDFIWLIFLFKAKNFEPFWGTKRRRSSIYEPATSADSVFSKRIRDNDKQEILDKQDDLHNFEPVEKVKEVLHVDPLADGEPSAKKSKSGTNKTSLVKICWGQILLRFLHRRTNLLCPKAWKQCINTNFSLC